MAEPASIGRPARKTPSELVANWPDEVAVDPVVETARLLAVNLRETIAGGSVRDAAKVAEVNYTTVYAILNGTNWPDLMTVARLEARLGADLYPAGVARTHGKTQSGSATGATQ